MIPYRKPVTTIGQDIADMISGFFGEKDCQQPVIPPWRRPEPVAPVADSVLNDIKHAAAVDEAYNPYWMDYVQLWDTMKYDVSKMEWHLKILKKNAEMYKDAAEVCGVPWQIIAVTHLMEAGGDLAKQIHNGQSWAMKSTIIPKGRGPFRGFVESCADALSLKKAIMPPRWNIQNSLYFLECWNGLGYRKFHAEVKSPYLWSFTNNYKQGKYASDGKWDRNLVSKQCGVAPLLKELGFDG